MSIRVSRVLGVIALVVTISAMSASAQSNSTTTLNARAESAPVQLPAGVWDVLRLIRAQIGEDTILSFIANSGQTYSLTSEQIIYLREQGVTDPVLTALLTQRNKAPVVSSATTNEWAAAAPQQQPSTVAPQTAQSAPVYAQPSAPIYVTPPAPVYYAYPSYYYPPVSLSFGFGFGFGGYYPHFYSRGGYYGGHWGGYRGHYGGGHYGGSFHGGHR